MNARAIAIAALGLSLASAARTQDFDAGAPWNGRDADALIASGLAGRSRGSALLLSATRWFGLPEFETRSASLACGWRALRAAAGAASTGAIDVGYTAAAAALGVAHPGGAVALRAVARRDRMGDPAAGGSGRDADPPGAGIECGVGAWLEAGPGLLLWASAPQMWESGVAPPLERGLTLGARIEGVGLAAWFARESVRAADEGATRGAHRAGLELDAGQLQVWAEARDAPLRAGLGIEAQLARLAVVARVESHPVLGETTQLALRLGGDRR